MTRHTDGSSSSTRILTSLERYNPTFSPGQAEVAGVERGATLRVPGELGHPEGRDDCSLSSCDPPGARRTTFDDRSLPAVS
jgi:hypothetical protein